MRKRILSLMVLAASLTGASAAVVAAPDMTRDEAISRLEAYMAASPFGHEALTKGVSDIAAASEGSASSVGSLYAAAVAGAEAELGENLYRVRVTMTNVGFNKGNEESPKLLASPGIDNSEGYFTLAEGKSSSSIWRFNDVGGKYTLSCNTGQFIGFDPNKEGVLAARREYTLEDPLEFVVAYAAGGNGVTFLYEGKYLALDAEGTLVLADELDDYAVWKINRAYDESLDLPVFSTDESPVYYTIRNRGKKGYMSIKDNYLTIVSARDEYSYWYFVESERNKGSFRLKNRKDPNLNIAYATSNGWFNVGQGSGTPDMLFFMLDGNESNGWSIHCNPLSYMAFAPYTAHAMMFDTAHSWIVGSKPELFGTDYKLFSWYFTVVDANTEAEFVEAKTKQIETISIYKTYSPWCQALLDKAINDVTNVDVSHYSTISEGIAAMQRIVSDAIDSYYTQINAEARGCSVKISNVRRKNSVNAAVTGHYLSAVEEEDGTMTLNTVTQLERNPGFWYIEGVEGDNMKFRLHNVDGLYIGNAENEQEVATTTDAAAAGLFTIYPYNGYLRIINADMAGSALNLDTYGGTLVGYGFEDEGSIWTFESVAVVPQAPGLPKLSTSTDQYLYLIQLASNDNDYLEYGIAGQGLIHNSINEQTYCYFLPANDGSDGVQIVAYFNDLRVRYDNYYAWCYPGWNDPSFNWYLVPHPSGKEGFVISHTYPVGASCIRAYSNSLDMPKNISIASPTDWETSSWIFKEVGPINYEAIFNERRALLVAEVESYQKSVPWTKQILDDLYDYLVKATVDDYSSQKTAADEIESYYNGVISSIEEELEIEAEGSVVSIANVRRLNGASEGAYLTAVDGALNTVNTLTDAGKWTLEYYGNGRYLLVNKEGYYMGELSSCVPVTSNRDEAGKYTLLLRKGYICLVDRNDPSNRALNINNSGGDACVYGINDEGSRWIMVLAEKTGIDAVENGASAAAEYYNLSGVKVPAEALTPGVYLRVRGSEAVKVLIK